MTPIKYGYGSEAMNVRNDMRRWVLATVLLGATGFVASCADAPPPVTTTTERTTTTTTGPAEMAPPPGATTTTTTNTQAVTPPE
jgi:hypothetical protein